MTRREKSFEEVTYEFSRLEILDAMRAVVQETYPGGALVCDKRNHRQQCTFIGPSGEILPVDGLVIMTTYEQPQSAGAVDPVVSTALTQKSAPKWQ